MDVWEFMQSWTFMAIMAGLLCFLVLLVPVGIVLLIVLLNRRDREYRKNRE